MTFARLFSFNTLANCRSVLCTRNTFKSCNEQRATLKSKSLAKLGLPVPPKRPLSPYFRFLAIQRQKLYNNESDSKMTSVIKKIANDWVNIDPVQKQQLQKEYLEELPAYLSKLEEYKNSITPEQLAIMRDIRDKEKLAKYQSLLNKKKESLGKPKKPTTAFIKFVIEKKSTRDISLKYTDWLKKISKEWETLEEEAKDKYKKKTEIEFQKYRENLIIWEEEMIRQGHTDIAKLSLNSNNTTKRQLNNTQCD